MTTTTDRLHDVFETVYSTKIADLAEAYPDRRALMITYETLQQHDSELAQSFLDSPMSIKQTADEVLSEKLENRGISTTAPVHVRLCQVPTQLETVTAHSPVAGTLVELDGVVTEADEPTTMIQTAVFRCHHCGSQTTIQQDLSSTLQQPTTCPGCERSDNIEINMQDSTLQAHQTATVAVAATLDDLTLNAESLTLTLTDDLTGITAGTEVSITGVFRRTQVQGSTVTDPHVVATATTEHNTSYPDTEGHSLSEFQTDIDAVLEHLSAAETVREEETKERLITPLLEALGWEKFHPGQWRFEYTDEMTSKRVDYALFAAPSDHPDVVVEAKQLGTELENHETQLYDYLRLFNAQAGLLTDGKTYRLYRNPSNADPTHVVTADIIDVVTGDLGDILQPAMFIPDTTADTSPSKMEWADTTATEINPDPDPEVIRMVLSSISDSTNNSGIPREKLYEHGEEEGFSQAIVEAAVEELRVEGRVYEAVSGYLQSTE